MPLGSDDIQERAPWLLPKGLFPLPACAAEAAAGLLWLLCGLAGAACRGAAAASEKGGLDAALPGGALPLVEPQRLLRGRASGQSQTCRIQVA